MGDGSDRTAIVVTNAKTHKIHAIFKSNAIQYKETFRFVYTLVYHYIPNSVLIVENNIDTLIEYIKNSSMKHLLYYEFPKNTTKDKRKKGILQPKDKNTIIYGITTNSQNRPKYFDILFEYVRNNKDCICCREMVEEIETLEYKSPTRVEAVTGKHDDVIMAYLLGEYVMQEGTNKARFGLFYADGLGTEYKKINSSVFKNSNINYNEYKPEVYNSPFLNELLVKPDTIEDLDRRWRKMISSYDQNDNINSRILKYDTDIFTGEKDITGISNIRNNSFKELNDYDPYRNLNMEDQFGVGSYNKLDFMEDLNNDFF